MVCVHSSHVFVVVIAVAALLWLADAKMAWMVFKVKVILDEVWMLLDETVKFIFTGRNAEKGQALHIYT